MPSSFLFYKKSYRESFSHQEGHIKEYKETMLKHNNKTNYTKKIRIL